MMMIVKDWLWRQVWKNESLPDTSSHVCNGYDVEELDPKAIFMYQVEERPFTMYHFIAHMVNMRIALPRERYRRHRQWVFDKQRQHIPTFKQLFIALLRGLLHSWLDRRERAKHRTAFRYYPKEVS